MDISALTSALLPFAIVIIAICAIGGLIFLIARNNDETPEESFSEEPSQQTEGPPPYRAKRFIFSRAEYSFYKVLLMVCPDDLVIVPKLRMADFLEISPEELPPKTSRKKWQNQINSKHADFVICDKKTMIVKGVIELDDKSHLSEQAKKRDAFKDSAFKAAQVPLMRQSCQKGYEPKDLKTKLSELITSTYPQNEKRYST